MQHFYVEPEAVNGDFVLITGSDVNHIKNVLRMKPGEELVICDGESHEYLCSVDDFTAEGVSCKILERRDAALELPLKVVLYQGLPKKDKMELIIQKAVELGASEIVPVVTKRTIVKLEDPKKEEKKTERWQAIAEAAAKQCGRGIIPKVKSPVTYKQALLEAKALDVRLIPYELAEGMDAARNEIAGLKDKKSVGVFIGPEGGFERSEIEDAVTAGVTPITLGKRILRTETAAICVLSVIMFGLTD